MSTKMGLKQLNIEIKPEVLNQAKSLAYANGMKLYQWVESAIVEKINKTNGHPCDQAAELRNMCKGENCES